MSLTGTGSGVDVVRFCLGTGIVPSLVKLKVLSERDNLCLYYLLSTTLWGDPRYTTFGMASFFLPIISVYLQNGLMLITEYNDL